MEEGGANDDEDEKSEHDGTDGETVLGLLLGVNVHETTLVDVAVELVGGGVEDALGTSLFSPETEAQVRDIVSRADSGAVRCDGWWYIKREREQKKKKKNTTARPPGRRACV